MYPERPITIAAEHPFFTKATCGKSSRNDHALIKSEKTDLRDAFIKGAHIKSRDKQ
jgi:hypothetical protein